MPDSPAHHPTDDLDAAPDCGARYELTYKLGAGATSTVWEALDTQTETLVAIKCIYPHFAGTRGSRDLLDRELGIARAVQHPGLVRTLDSGATASGGHFIVMELLRGVTMQDKLRMGISVAEGLRLIEEVLQALAALHAAGVVHRDLKPSNIFITEDGRTKLIDLGIAKADAIDASMTATGTTLGTPIYMSPEQAVSPKKVVPASDVWSIGVVLYELVVGHAPFEGDVAYDIVLRVCTEAHVPTPSAAPDEDPRLTALIDRCLDKLPENRPANAGQLASEMSELMGTRPLARHSTDINSRPPPVAAMHDHSAAPPTLLTTAQRPGLMPWFILVVLIVVVGFLGWMLAVGQTNSVALVESVPSVVSQEAPPSAKPVVPKVMPDADPAPVVEERPAAVDVAIQVADGPPAETKPAPKRSVRQRRPRKGVIVSQPAPAEEAEPPVIAEQPPAEAPSPPKEEAPPIERHDPVEQKRAKAAPDAGLNPVEPATPPPDPQPEVPAPKAPKPEPKAEEPAPFITF